MMFFDEAVVTVRSGNGGNGCVSFLRERNNEYGGPNGGDGGDGGDITAVCITSLNTLTDYRYQQHLFAQNGRNGEGKQKSGARGLSASLKLPQGTQIWHGDSLIADFTKIGQEITIAKGGKGGVGNIRFRSSTNRTPRQSTPGEKGIELELRLVLKLFADVGVIGLPNAGKSTLVSTVSAAKPKIAGYPFTTLKPSLGTVEIHEERFVIADIPGLIEGANEGAGLGTQFLKHIERCSTLLHLVDANSADPLKSYDIVHEELAAYGKYTANKPEIIALSKIDTVSKDQLDEVINQLREKFGDTKEILCISAATMHNINQLLLLAAKMIREYKIANENLSNLEEASSENYDN